MLTANTSHYGASLKRLYVFLIVVLNWWLNANLSLNLPRSTCDERKPSVHEDRDSAVANEYPYIRYAVTVQQC